MSLAIWWIRRDLRLNDNQALQAALSQAEKVLPIFILDPKLLDSTKVAQRRVDFLFDGLRTLECALHERGSKLVVRQGDPLAELQTLIHDTGAKVIIAEADISPYAKKRDNQIRRELPLMLVPGNMVHPPETLRKPDGTPYTVYTPFRRMWEKLAYPGSPSPAPEWLSTPTSVPSLNIPDSSGLPVNTLFEAGEGEARRRLDAFSGTGIYRYTEERNRMDMDGTSRLSPYLRFGMLSARHVAWAIRRADEEAADATSRQGVESWMNELIWREFYMSIMYHYPFVHKTAFRPEMRGIEWRDDSDGFNAWATGRTGFPVVDAGMRQMNATGWMHNRARMITASFLTKDLLINWQDGERFFMRNLLDGDPASNNGGWQWSAGTGTDAAPYFRIFNPVLQGKKFDPDGAYVRRWVPELAAVPDAYIHTPWVMPVDVQRRLGCVIGRDYPTPIVDHSVARLRVLEAYRRGRR